MNFCFNWTNHCWKRALNVKLLIFCTLLYRTTLNISLLLQIDYDMPGLPVHSQLIIFMTNLPIGQVFSCWSNVSRLRFDQHIGQLTNLWQWVTLTLTKIWLTYDQDMNMMLVKSSPRSTPSKWPWYGHPMTTIWPGILGLSYECTPKKISEAKMSTGWTHSSAKKWTWFHAKIFELQLFGNELDLHWSLGSNLKQ